MTKKERKRTTISISDEVILKVYIQMKLLDDGSFNDVVNNLLREKFSS